MALGKTETLYQFCRTQKTRYKRILFVTCRKQLSRTLLGKFKDLDFQQYEDVQQVRTNLKVVDRLIVQYESLCHLHPRTAGGALTPYDLIVIDECRSCLSQMCCQETNANHLLSNVKLLALLMSPPKTHTILMDADLKADGMVDDFVTSAPSECRRGPAKKVFQPGEVLTIEYKGAPPANKLVLCRENDWFEAIHTDIKDGKRIMIVFRQKDKLQTFLTVVRTRHPYLNPQAIISFDGDSSQEEMKAFEDIDDVIQRRCVQVLAFTSKVTCGADVQTPFSSVYVHCSHGEGPSARDVFQMFGRCRNCESHQIRVTFPDTKSKSPDTHKLQQPSLDEAHGLELKKLIDRKSYKDQIVQAIASEMEAEYNPDTDQLEDPMSKPNWTPHWFLSLYAWHKVEQGEDFKSSFYRHATRKGYFFHSLSNLTAAGTESVHAEVTDHVT